MLVILALALAALLVQQPETLSLLGEPLYPFSLSRSARAKADEDLRTAHAAYEKAPNDVAAILALAQAHRALGRVGDAIVVLTHGLEANPQEPRLLLARGGDYIAIRKFEVAQRELAKVTAKLPEAYCPLGLAQYLTAAYSQAHDSYAHCSEAGIFGYLSARRAGQAQAGPPPAVRPPAAPEDIRLPGSTAPRQPKAQVPLAADYLDAIEQLVAGKQDEAVAQLKEIVKKHRRDEWMDPVYIAAEADYARLYKPPHKHKKRT